MADVKISNLPPANTPLAGTEVLPIVQSTTTKKVAVADLTAGRALSATSLTLTTPLAVTSGGTGLAAGTSGGIPYFSSTTAITSSAALAANQLVIGGGAGSAPSTTTTGAGILTFLGTPSSANLAAAVTDETGTGALVFGTSPTFTTSANFPAGTASAPGIAAAGDTNTGIFFPAADTVAFSTNGNEDARFDSVGNLLLNSATLSPTQTAAGSIAMTGTLAMGSSFLRNRIINGDMRIDQRNAGASVTPTAAAYTLDRWDARLTQASKYSVTQSTTVPNNTFTNSLLVTSTSAYSVLSGDNFGLAQTIEGFNTADLAWGTSDAKAITISFWARSSIAGTNTYAGSLRNDAGDRSYVFTYTLAANTWTYVTVTVPGPTSGTWLTNNSGGIYFQFSLGTGNNFHTTANAWQNGNFLSVSGATSVVGTNGATFYITGVQLEVGSVATPFERRQYGQELALCQRYYYKIVSNTDIPLANAYVASTTSAIAIGQFPVSLRAAPTALEQTGTAANYQVRAQATSTACSAAPAFATATTDVWSVTATVASGLTAGNGGALRGAATGAYLAWSAEL